MKSVCCIGLSTVSAFEWGSASASYQVEGYRTADGRQPSIWDAFDTPMSDVVKSVKPDGTPNVLGEPAWKANEEYVRYPETAAALQHHGFGFYRMSVSWSRIMTISEENGRLVQHKNHDGIEHYKQVFHAFRRRGIKIALTMYQWDTPLIIEEFTSKLACGSTWLCPEVTPPLFGEYADVLVSEFGRYVEWWGTINEPRTVLENGHVNSAHAPGRCSDRQKCWAGNELTDPYMVAKTSILAHAHAFRAWERHGRPGKGCSIIPDGNWMIPFTNSSDDVEAANRMFEFQTAPLFLDPIVFGEWPPSVVKNVGSRLPAWSKAERLLVKGTHSHMLLVNSYTARFVRAVKDEGCGWNCDPAAEASGYDFVTGEPVGKEANLAGDRQWLFSYGPSLGRLLSWYQNRYKGFRFIVTESGWGGLDASMKDALNDFDRCNYYRDILGNLSAIAASDHVNVIGYTAWALMDNFEWEQSFGSRYGLTFVNFTTQERYPKLSLSWLRRHVLPLKSLPVDGKPFPACEASSYSPVMV
jgi:beta-glucosidase